MWQNHMKAECHIKPKAREDQDTIVKSMVQSHQKSSEDLKGFIVKWEVMNMLEKKIRLRAVDDVREFVRAAEKCEFDVDVFYNRMIIDAKSIIGVMSMDLTKTLTVKYSAQDGAFEEVLDKFAVA